MENSKDLTMPARRDMLLMTAKGAAGLVAATMLGGVSRSALAAYSLAPTVTEGPFCLDSVANNLLRSDIRISSVTGKIAAGFPLVLTVTVSKLNANGTISPINGAYVDIWHCDADGNYSGETNMGAADLTAEDYLRGYQITNARGAVKFISIYPGWYTSRTTHIHIRIRTFSGSTAVYDQATQFFFDESLTEQIYTTISQYLSHGLKDTANATDSVFTGGSNQSATDGITSDSGDHLMLTLANNGNYVTASINLVIATSEGVASLSCPTVADTSGSTSGGGTPPTGTPPTGTPPTRPGG